MAPARSPQPRPSSSAPTAAAATPRAAARPEDEARAWAYLAQQTAWERRLEELRRRAGTEVGTDVPARIDAPAPVVPAAARRDEAA